MAAAAVTARAAVAAAAVAAMAVAADGSSGGGCCGCGGGGVGGGAGGGRDSGGDGGNGGGSGGDGGGDDGGVDGVEGGGGSGVDGSEGGSGDNGGGEGGEGDGGDGDSGGGGTYPDPVVGAPKGNALCCTAQPGRLCCAALPILHQNSMRPLQLRRGTAHITGQGSGARRVRGCSGPDENAHRGTNSTGDTALRALDDATVHQLLLERAFGRLGAPKTGASPCASRARERAAGLPHASDKMSSVHSSCRPLHGGHLYLRGPNRAGPNGWSLALARLSVEGIV